MSSELLDFFADKLGLKEVRRTESQQGRFTLIFLAADENPEAQVELTYNWDPEIYTGGRNFGHLAYSVADIYATCQELLRQGRDHQSPAARRPHGVRQVARRHLDRASAAGRGAAAARAMDLDAERRELVGTARDRLTFNRRHDFLLHCSMRGGRLTHYSTTGFRSGPSRAHVLVDAAALSTGRGSRHARWARSQASAWSRRYGRPCPVRFCSGIS